MKGERERRWVGITALWVGAAALAVAIVALIVSMIVGRSEIATWTGYDWLRKDADGSQVRILVATLRGDPNGKFTAELRASLQKNGKRFRELGRAWEPTEEERLDTELERKAITKLLNEHQSEVLLHGYVGVDGAKILEVPIERGQPKRQHLATSQEDFDNLVRGLDSTLATVIQGRIEANKWLIGRRGRHARLDAQIEDLLAQIQTDEVRSEVSFQSAFAKSKLGFWNQDENLVQESAQIYERLLEESPPARQEAFIRINLGAHYAEQGEKRNDIGLLEKSKEHFAKAESILELLPDVDRWAKVRTLQSNADIIAYSIDGDTERLDLAIKRQTETLEDATGWLTQARALLTEQELVGAELLLAYEQKDGARLRHHHRALEENRKVWSEWAKEAGQSRNPWVLALMHCTADRLLPADRLAEALRGTPETNTNAVIPAPLRWSLDETVARRERVEKWVEKVKAAGSNETHRRQLGRLADLTREEALRSHDHGLLAESIELTQEFRRQQNIEDTTFSYRELDLSSPFTRAVFEIESALALACADRPAIERLIVVHDGAAKACTGTRSVCTEAGEWMKENVQWLKHGLGRWDVEDNDEDGRSGDATFATDGNWSKPEPHARWLREKLRKLPPEGESWCPLRVAWVD